MNNPTWAALLWAVLAPLAWFASASAASAGEPAPSAETPPGGAAGAEDAGLTVVDAVEGLVDEDDATRRAAIQRLQRATESDIPVLEKYASHTDPEIRYQTGLILKRLKRGEVAFLLAFPDGSVSAGSTIAVKLYEGEIQVHNNGPRLMVQAMNRQGLPAKEVFDAELKSDAQGRIAVGKFNDGDLNYVIETQDPLPRQMLTGKIAVKQDVAPVKLAVRKGTVPRVTVVTEKDEPLAEAQVYLVEDGNFIKQVLKFPPNQLQMHLRQFPAAPTDAQGLATLERTTLSQLNIFVLKPGFEPLCKEKIAAEDGATVDVKITLSKAKPATLKLTIRDKLNKPVKGARVLAVSQVEVGKVIGPQWNTSLDAAQIDAYLKQGAIDLGPLDEKSGLAAEIVPDTYVVIVFVSEGGAILLGSMTLNTTGKENNLTVRCNPVNKPAAKE